jgi:hypothetical protein
MFMADQFLQERFDPGPVRGALQEDLGAPAGEYHQEIKNSCFSFSRKTVVTPVTSFPHSPHFRDCPKMC